MTDSQPAYVQQPVPKKGMPRWVFALIALGVLGLGTCVYSGVKMFGAISDRSAASLEVSKAFLTDGLPDAGDPIYAKRLDITQETVDSTNRFFAQFGPVSEYSDASCNLKASANTNAAQSGTFATCVLQIQAEHSPGTVTVTWVREEETWKLGGFYVNFHDNSVLMDKAEKLDAMEAADESADAGPETEPSPE
jgi:hypothetical protein